MSYHQTIYNRLRQHGLTEAGALGVLGNWECESNCEPFRVQGDFSSFKSISKAYVSAIEYGKMPKSTFVSDQKGFGLAQWTYFTRKAELWEEWEKSGKKIDDIDLQISFALKELDRDFPKDAELLRTTNDIYAAVKAVCERFENPAIKNYDARFRAATTIKFEIDLNEWSSQPQEPTGGEDEPKDDDVDHSLTLRTIDKNCTGFNEVWLLQSVLLCRGYIETNPDGNFGSYLEARVKLFQKDNGLVSDGIVGNQTWNALLKR